MTAREFSDLFKPYVPVRRIAEAAGFREGTWYMAVTRDRILTEDERTRLQAAVIAHGDELRALASQMK